MRLFLLIVMFTIFSAPSFADELDQPLTLSETWASRPSPEPPSTNEENIAVLAASEHRDVTEKDLVAKYDGIKDRYEMVTVTSRPESESDMLMTLRFKIIDRQISAETHPTYRVSLKKEQQQESPQQTARQAAINANGIDTVGPVLYEDKALTIKFNGRCKATVTEKNLNREVQAEYRFDLCN